MSANSQPSVVDIFKRVYGKANDLLPEDYMLAKDIPFSEKQKVGEKYIEAAVLTNEVGFTLAGNGYDAFELNSPIAGAVKQAEVTPYISTLSSIIPWSVISRSAGAGDKSFFDATKFVTKNNLKSHGKLAEIMRIYGQSPELLGYVSYSTSTYRGVAFVNGTGTLQVDGSSVAFTNGVNAASKYILLSPGQWASGIWVGMEGVIVQQVNASNVVVAEGSVTYVNSEYGFLGVDFTPVAATSTTSHRLGFKGMAESKEMIGVHKILTNTGTLFGIPTANYSLWKGNSINNNGLKFKLADLQNVVAQAVNRGGLEGDLNCYVNARTWATMVTTESGSRRYDASYKGGSEAESGFESITFHHQTGKTVIRAHRMIKEGHAMLLHPEDWSRSGSAEIAFSIPGMEKDIIYPLENQAGYKFTSFSDQYLFCNAPAKSIWLYGVNDESAS